MAVLALAAVASLVLAASPASATTPAVRLEVGHDFQAAVDAQPPGTRFTIAAGVHRGQSVRPKDGMVFTGEPGAVMSGAAVLTEFSADGDAWTVSGQTQGPLPRPSGTTRPGHERDNYREELFIDGRRLKHVASQDEVGPGRWFFDYDRDRIVVGDDPTGRLVETSVAPAAFHGQLVRDVTVENLMIRHYASAAQRGAIDGHNTRHWVLRHNDVGHNHGGGIGIGPGAHVHHNIVHRNGQIGIVGDGDDRYPVTDGYTAPVTVEFNEIAHNHQLEYDWHWEAGGTKFKHTTGMVFQHNWVHHNKGAGIWFDIDNVDATIRSNLVEDNTEVGIIYEIGFAARIYWNVSRGHNAANGAPPGQGVGILLVNSADVDAYENAISDNSFGLIVREGDRGAGALGEWRTRNVAVRDNDIAMRAGWTGLSNLSSVVSYPELGARTQFTGNTYRLDQPQAARFRWDNDVRTPEAWQGYGQDVDGRFLTSGSAALPADASVFDIADHTETLGPLTLLPPEPQLPETDPTSPMPPGGAAGEGACPAGAVPPGGFTDTGGNAHEAAIDCVVWWGIAQGRDVGRYAPSDGVTREQMATFLARLIDRSTTPLPGVTGQRFADVAGVHAAAVERLAAAGIAQGTGPATFDPKGLVTRAQMATFLVRTQEMVTGSVLQAGSPHFTDVGDGAHAANIDKAAAANLTLGVTATAFAPQREVVRGQMASFLQRSLDLLVDGGHIADR